MDMIPMTLTPIAKAFALCREKYPNMVDPTRIAHEVWLDQEFQAGNSKRIAKDVIRFSTNYEELPIESLHGKLSLKAEKWKFEHDDYALLMNFQKVEFRQTLSGLAIESCLANNVWSWRREKRTGSDGIPRTVTIVELGGTEVEKDLLYGYCDEPGQMVPTHVGSQRLSKDFQTYYQRRGSMAFTVSSWCTEEMLLKYWTLSSDYNSSSRYERRSKKKRRYRTKQLGAAKQLMAKPFFYLPVWPDYRGRENYFATRVVGLRPQGSLAETLFIDAAIGRVIDEAGQNDLKHVIYVNLHRKVGKRYAVRYFSDKDREAAKALDPMAVEKPDVAYSEETKHLYKKARGEFGKALLLRKAIEALELAEAGKPCQSIFGIDIGNAGLCSMAQTFRSPKMRKSANLAGKQNVEDSHMDYGVAHFISHLPRDLIKDVHTPLLCGQSPYTTLDVIQKLVDNPDDYTVEGIEDHNADVYGEEVYNISMITEYGTDIVTNTQNIFKWKMPDGFPAEHRAVIDRAEYYVPVSTTRIKGAIKRDYKVIGTVPMTMDSKRIPNFSKESATGSNPKGAQVKSFGLFANMTHAIEAQGLRMQNEELMDRGETFLTKHDNTIVLPGTFDVVVSCWQKYYGFLHENNLYQMMLDQIAAKTERPIPAPRLIVGTAEDKSATSVNFLMP